MLMKQEDTSVKLFWEGSLLMGVEFYLAFQVSSPLPSGVFFNELLPLLD